MICRSADPKSDEYGEYTVYDSDAEYDDGNTEWITGDEESVKNTQLETPSLPTSNASVVATPSIPTRAVRNDEGPWNGFVVTSVPHVQHIVFKSGKRVRLNAEQQAQLDVARSQVVPEPVNATTLRDNLERGFEKLNIFDDRPRSDFYTVSDANVTQDMPLLMDAFTYCEDDHLHLDAIFNIKYFVVTSKKRVAYKSLDDLWFAQYRNVVVKNEMMKDNHKHSIVTTFTFPFSCDSHDGDFLVFSNATRFSYNFTASYVPDFTTNRYYLSACTSIDASPENQVLAWLNYNYYQGVQHFTIYLNARVDFWRNQLHRYVEKGLLDLIEYTYPRHRFLFEQNSALNACNRRYRYASKFVIYNDVDEYFLPMNTTWRVIDVVRFYDASFPDVEAFRVGSAGRR